MTSSEINTESSLQIMNSFWGKNVISTEEAELILLGSSKWNYSLFPKQPGCNMYFYHLDLLPRAEPCSVFGIEDVMFGLQNVPAFDSHKGHLVMLSFWDEHMYLDHFSIMNYFFCITCQHLFLKLSGTLPKGEKKTSFTFSSKHFIKLTSFFC